MATIRLSAALERIVLDGRFTAEFNADDNSVSVWDAEQGDELVRLKVRIVDALTGPYNVVDAAMVEALFDIVGS